MKVEVYDLKLCSRTTTNLCLWNEHYGWMDKTPFVKTKDFSMNLKRILSVLDVPETSANFCRKVIKLCKDPSYFRTTKLFIATCDLWLPVFDLVEVADRLDLIPIAENVMTPLKAFFGVALSVISFKDIPNQISAICAKNATAADRVIAFLNLVADVAHTALGILFFITAALTSVASITILITVTVGLAANIAAVAIKKIRESLKTEAEPKRKLIRA